MHYQPPQVDDSLSSAMFDALLKALDPESMYLSNQAIKKVERFRYLLDDALRESSCQALQALTDWYRQELRAVDTLIAGIEPGDIRFSAAEHIRLRRLPSRRAAPRAADMQALRQHWRRWITYRLLLAAWSAGDPDMNSEAGLTRFGQARQAARCKLSRILAHPLGFEAFVATEMQRVMAEMYDPHTTYFSARERELFEAALATSAYSFGISLDESRQGEIRIARLLPGGPAWKSNALNTGDVLLEIGLPNGENIEMLCMNAWEVEQLLYQGGHPYLRLKVRKANGQIREVSLQREKIEMEENIVSSFVLDGNPRLGYVYLPAFYLDWEDENALGCANDVAKELLKLQAEGIEGLILDVRNNGGGSMKEALDLAGIFIDIGPVAIVESGQGQLSLLKDHNRGTIYTGPLIVMVNGHSASASEIFAAALQDYHRAVIVGSKTYGKSTGQLVLPADMGTPDPRHGFMKVTMHKYYRINGHSYQKEGLQPDLLLPEPLMNVSSKEADEPRALPGGRVDKQLSYRPWPPLPLQALAHRSAARLQVDENFRQIREFNEQLPPLFAEGLQLPLEMSAFRPVMRELNQQLQWLNTVNRRKTAAFRVSNHAFNQMLLQLDPNKLATNQAIREDIEQDIYIEEAYHIMKDLIALTKP
ncbi:MAG: hypothetical protein D6730_04690 [Bacteroidetes bacterium]|nr:MAG: hypothetical protein D6730_04690 [Bacteroidota bacterium]